jgi:hypothetical protein
MKVTLPVIKADVGSIGGQHGPPRACSPPSGPGSRMPSGADS